MSIVTLTKKTKAKTNISGRGPKQNWIVQGPFGSTTAPAVVSSTGFSLNGGHRNQGWVGQTSLARSVTRTPFRGAAPMGHGNIPPGRYDANVLNSGSCCKSSSNYIKTSSLTTSGMLAKKYKWRNGYHGANGNLHPTKPTNQFGEYNQASYIQVKKNSALVSSKTGTYIRPIQNISGNCATPHDDSNKNHCTDRKLCSYFIGTRKYKRTSYNKDMGPMTSHEYLSYVNEPSLRTHAITGKDGKTCSAGTCAQCDGISLVPCISNCGNHCTNNKSNNCN